jgi:hypothetical protein
MTEAEWFACVVPDSMVMLIGSKVGSRKLRLVACACCRRIWHLYILKRDQPSRRLVEIVEAVADGIGSELRLLSLWEEAQRSGYRCDRNSAADRTACLMTDYLGEVMVHAASAAGDIASEQIEQCRLMRDIFGNPFRPVAFNPDWRTTTAIQLAKQMYDARDFSAMPILADALQDAGCDHADILDHCRGPGPHIRGCWVVDLVLEKE